MEGIEKVKMPSRKPHYTPLCLESITEKEPFNRYFTMKFDAQCKRSVNPYEVIKVIKNSTGAEAKVMTLNKTSFFVEVMSKEQSEKMNTIDAIKNSKCKTGI